MGAKLSKPVFPVSCAQSGYLWAPYNNHRLQMRRQKKVGDIGATVYVLNPSLRKSKSSPPKRKKN
jgi:hypothetical protein